MARFNDIMRAEELLKAKKAYDDYLALDAAAKAAAYKASQVGGAKRLRVGKRKGWVKLFGSDDGWIACNLLSSENLNMDATTGDTDTTLVTAVTAAVIGAALYAVTTKPSASGNSIVAGANLQGKLAKVTLKKSTGDKIARTSRFTKRAYKAANSNSASCVFGALVGGTATTGTYQAAVDALTAALVPTGSENLSVRFKPQGNISVE